MEYNSASKCYVTGPLALEQHAGYQAQWLLYFCGPLYVKPS